MGKVLIGIDKTRQYRVYLTLATDLVESAREVHQTSPLATAGLGRVLMGAGLMGSMLKDDKSKLTVSFKGDGPAQQILATAYGDGRVKGYIANPNIEMPLNNGKLDVGASLGIGELKVIKDLGMREPYIGSIALVTGEIADDLTAYFFISEQQNSSVSMGIKLNEEGETDYAGAMIIQMLPGFTEDVVDKLEEWLKTLKPLSTLIGETLEDSGLKAGKTEQAVLAELLAHIFEGLEEEYQPAILDYKDMYWCCDCSHDRMEQALMTVGREELSAIIEEDGQAELTCQFCEKKYSFDEKELKELLEKIS